MRPGLVWVVAIALAASAFAGACGNGGSGEGQGARETDPALVPTSTPIQEPLTFRVRNDEIEVVTGGQGGTNGGTSGQGPQTHTVAEGETCQDIADQYGITVEALIRANRTINADCTNLGSGQELRIPSAAPTPGAGTPTPGAGGGNTYTVAEGDTCADIAAQFGVSADEIIQLNGLDSDCASLQVGDVLQIP